MHPLSSSAPSLCAIYIMRNTNASCYCFFSFLTSSSELSVSESLTSLFFTAFSFLLESLKNGFIVLGNECYRPRYSVLAQNTHHAFSPREFRTSFPSGVFFISTPILASTRCRHATNGGCRFLVHHFLFVSAFLFKSEASGSWTPL